MFTSKERDTETGLDFFGPMHVSSAHGRFTSADSYVFPENKIEDTPEGAFANPMNDEMKKLTIWTGLLGLLMASS